MLACPHSSSFSPSHKHADTDTRAGRNLLNLKVIYWLASLHSSPLPLGSTQDNQRRVEPRHHRPAPQCETIYHLSGQVPTLNHMQTKVQRDIYNSYIYLYIYI